MRLINICSSMIVLSMLIGSHASGQQGHASVTYPGSLSAQETYQNHNGFGRLFSVGGEDAKLLPHPSPRHDLRRLGRKMIQKEDTSAETNMPLAYVFFGQFIDHDITLDTVTGFDQLVLSTSNLENARTVDLDLDCVYGGGPERSPYLYDGARLRVGETVVKSGSDQRARYDLLRTSKQSGANQVALIGDPRNDENFVVSQMQAAFIAYHNRMVDRLMREELDRIEPIVSEEVAKSAGSVPKSSERLYRATTKGAQLSEQWAAKAASAVDRDNPSLPVEQKVEEALQNYKINFLAKDKLKQEEFRDHARDLTIHHYHRLILEDFLPRIIGTERTKHMLQNGRSFYFPYGFRKVEKILEPFIPIEFAVAAYRFGHSQVPARMTLRNGRDSNKVAATLFHSIGAEPNDLKPTSFTPIITTQGSLVIDWNHMLDIRAKSPQTAQSLDTKLSLPLSILADAGVVPPDQESNLASRNLSRGRSFELPSGQDLAALVLEKLFPTGALNAYVEKGKSAPKSFDGFLLPADKETQSTLTIDESPLWYYILQESGEFGTLHSSSKWRLPGRVTKLDDKKQKRKGATLGPVGATIVGETLIGLIEHYRVKTGGGIDYNTNLDNYIELPENGQPDGEIQEITLTETLEENGFRYLLRNFIFDAGLAQELGEDVVVLAPPS